VENTERVTQWCHACSQADTHPRHHHYDGAGRLVSKHIDCCARQGCPDGSCYQVLSEASNARGDALTAHMENRAHKAQEAKASRG
jgi:hypothetical protein